MRESNFAFPAQNKACVCITSQLYDRRALDTTAPLPLFNSLTHLTYLTSTSPRIREIMTMDGGLERLVRILHDFCICPPPPENPAILYGLTPPSSRPPKPAPALNPPNFDKHAAYRFSLAFQCIVNIGVRGSEPIRSRVVQAGTLDVVGCILEAWLANKGFAVGPSATATGVPRETREQRQQRKQAQSEQRQREEAAQLQRALQRQLQVEQQVHRTTVRDAQRWRIDDQDDSMDYTPSQGLLLLSDSQPSASASTSNNNSDTDVSADASIAATPQGSGTPTGSVVIPARDRSGTVIGRPVWDYPQQTQTQQTQRTHNPNYINSNHTINNNGTTTATVPMTINTTLTPTNTAPRGRRLRHRELPPESPSPSPSDASRADTETEDDGDGEAEGDAANTTDNDVDMSSQISASASASPSPDRRPRHMHQHQHPHGGRRTVGIVADEPADASAQTLQLAGMGLDMGLGIGVGGLGGLGLGPIGLVGEMGMGMDGDDEHIIVGRPEGMEAGIVALEANDDFAMGAPPGAPGAIGRPAMTDSDGQNNNTNNNTGMGIGEQTPRGGGAARRNAVESAMFAPDVTPRAALVGLPAMNVNGTGSGPQRTGTVRGRSGAVDRDGPGPSSAAAGSSGSHSSTGRASTSTVRASSPSPSTSTSNTNSNATAPTIATAPTTTTTTATTAIPFPPAPTTSTASSSTHHTHREPESGPYRDEDVLLSLQLLAYLSKYPHVRQAFYKPRVTFHPASVGVGGARFGSTSAGTGGGKAKEKEREREKEKVSSLNASSSTSTRDGFFKTFGVSRTKAGASSSSAAANGAASSSSAAAAAPVQPSPSSAVPGSGTGNGAPSSARQTNVFSLVERFTFKPSSSEAEGSVGGGGAAGVPPRLPPEIQYWAGVIMRNACRKDDSRGGIRQCANMMCGKWETYPREFAKCRRCRKAKYCGKECQSTAWSEGHRFWCSAKDVDEEGTSASTSAGANTTTAADTSIASNASADIQVAGEGAPTLNNTLSPHAPHQRTAPAPGTNAPTQRVERQRLRHGVQHGPEGDLHPLNIPNANAAAAALRGFRAPTADATGSTYVSPTAAAMPMSMGASTTVRAESGMARDRTVVGVSTHHGHGHGHRTRVRPSLGGAAGSGSGSSTMGQEPTNSNYLTFHIQGSTTTAGHSQRGHGHSQDTVGRRRAETITITSMFAAAASRASGSSGGGAASAAGGDAGDAPPNVVIPAPQHPVAQPVSLSDWAMNISNGGGGGGAAAAAANSGSTSAGSSRRHRPMNVQQQRVSSPPQDEQDDMVLG